MVISGYWSDSCRIGWRSLSAASSRRAASATWSSVRVESAGTSAPQEAERGGVERRRVLEGRPVPDLGHLDGLGVRDEACDLLCGVHVLTVVLPRGHDQGGGGNGGPLLLLDQVALARVGVLEDQHVVDRVPGG